MKNVLLVNYTKFPDGDAGGIRVLSFAKAIQRLGYNVRVLTSGKERNMNGLYQGINYYLDFRIFGFIIFPFLFGYSISAIINFFEKKRTVYSFIILITSFYLIFMNIMSLSVQSNCTLFSFIFIYILHKKKLYN